MPRRLKCLPVVLIAVAVSIGLLSPTAYATESRVISMGGVGFYMNDNTNIFYFPGALPLYDQQVVSELRVKGDDESYSVGVHLPMGSSHVLGIYLNRPVTIVLPSITIGGETFGVTDIAENVKLENTTHLLLGMPAGTMNVGFGLAYALDSYSEDVTEDTEQKESARYFQLSAGASSEMMDFGVALDLPSIKYELDDEEESWSGFGLGASGRAFLEMDENTRIVPLGRLYFASSSIKDDPGSGADEEQTDLSQLNLGLGIGVNRNVTEKNMLIVGIEVIGLSKIKAEMDKDEMSNRVLTFPGLYIGIESQVKPWLVARMGGAQVFQSIKESTDFEGEPTSEQTTHESQFDLSFGLGVHLKDLTLDAVVNEGLLFDGPNFISGSDEPVSTRLSMTFAF